MEAQANLNNLDKLWSDLIGGVLDAPQRLRVLEEVASDLNSAVARRPESTALLETLGRVFGDRALTAEMWPSAESAVSLEYGPAAVRVLTWLLDDVSQVQQRFDEILPMLDIPSEVLLRDILARHVEDLGWSYFIWFFRTPEEWRNINIDTFQVLGANRYSHRVRLTLVNGKTFSFESRAPQMLVLVRTMLAVLNDLPAAAFPQTEVEPFLEQARRLVDTLSASSGGPQERAPAEASDGSTPEEPPRSPTADGIGE